MPNFVPIDVNKIFEGIKKDGKDKRKCRLCGKLYAFSGVKPMKNHILSKHFEVWDHMRQGGSPILGDHGMEDREFTAQDQEKADTNLAQFMCSEGGKPMSMLKNRAFPCFLEELSPGYKAPDDEKFLTTVLPQYLLNLRKMKKDIAIHVRVREDDDDDEFDDFDDYFEKTRGNAFGLDERFHDDADEDLESD